MPDTSSSSGSGVMATALRATGAALALVPRDVLVEVLVECLAAAAGAVPVGVALARRRHAT